MIRALAVTLLLACSWPTAAAAQIFLGSKPTRDLTVGPLFVVARITPDLDAPVAVNVYFSLVVPPGVSGADVEQDVYLLWPGRVIGDAQGRPDRRLKEFADVRHLKIVEQGTLKLEARNFYRLDGDHPPEPIPGGAPYVSFAREGGALGSTAPATYIRIPWTPRLVNRLWLIDLAFKEAGLVQLKRATWIEEAFAGRRHIVSLSFHDLRSRALFPVYFEQRDRVLKLADDPSQIILTFADSDHLKIDQMSPPSASRRPSESRKSTEMVSLYLDPSQGLAPQVLTVQFGYFSGLQSWTPILLPMAFFALGNLAGPLIRAAMTRLAAVLSARVQVGRGADQIAGKASGVVLSRETLARLAPGETTFDEVVRLCGPSFEEHEESAQPGRRTLVYRGRRAVPRRRRSYGWLATIAHWDIEDHEVEIQIEDDRVRDVQARVRRSRLASPQPA